MLGKLWFVHDGVNIIGVYTSSSEARLDYERFRYDSDFDYYKIYTIDLDDLEDNPDEYDYALEQGVI